MKSLGVIETQGFVTAIQATDAACKAAGVRCTGFRKTGSGLVSVCFEGEISAIHVAIERGAAVAGENHQANSLVIARPERSVVEALSTLKGYPLDAETPCEAIKPDVQEQGQITPAPIPLEKEPEVAPSVSTTISTTPIPSELLVQNTGPQQQADKETAMKKGKKA